MSIFLRQLLDIPVTDPDDARRRQLLNIILLGFSGLVLLSIIVILIGSLEYREDGLELLITHLGFLIAAVLIYFINRFKSGVLASSTFLIFLSFLLILSDTTEQMANGRTLFVFVIPIILASVLLRSHASFILAGINSLIIIFLALSIKTIPNFPAVIGFFSIALVSWLSARSLESALHNLRTINAELDQRVAERTKELAELASQGQAILQGIADGVVVIDASGKVILANPALTRLIDIPLEKIISRNTDEFLTSSTIRDDDRSLLLDVLRTTNPSPVSLRLRWGEKTLSVNAAPVMDQEEKFIGHVAVFRDFTREAEVDEMKSSILAMVSHDLCTPLNAIMDYSEMLRDTHYGPLSKKQTNAADRIQKISNRLLELVADLMDKAQIEAGHLNLSVFTFQPRVLTENLHGVMDKIASDKDLSLISTIDSDMPDEIKGDLKRIQQVMANLVNNAVKFTEKGSITVNLYKAGNEYWAFDVVDTGPGIAPEDQSYIFEPFRQVDRTITSSNGGVGLGLSIVKRLVDLMGGRILLKSTLGQGSAFTVLLPSDPPQKGIQA